ncbi:helix-turn-helix domain-containing protein [Microbacterium sp.]|jgi:hypothetical protein|uniref:helix-turn-helix domain-containing protein n=1 Tax=Microbacterium sp. TaxID=51671 RepID=UPI0037CA4D0B
MALIDYAADLDASSDRFCIRGCARQHWAVCENLSPSELSKREAAEDAGERYTPPCAGCAPSVCRVGSLVCDQCFGRARGLLRDAPELLQRLRSMTDDGRSRWNFDRVVVTSSHVGTAANVGDDITDAIHAIETALHYFRAGLAALTGDAEAMGWLGPLVLDEHPAVDGVRERWSIRDAMSRWGMENRHRFIHPDARPNAPRGAYAAYDDEEVVAPVREWFDPLVTVEQAAQRRGVSNRTVKNWIRKGYITPVATAKTRYNTLTYFHASDVDAADAEVAAKRTRPLDGQTRAEPPYAARARELHAAGLTGRAIAAELGITPGTVSKWAKAEGLDFSKGRMRGAV